MRGDPPIAKIIMDALAGSTPHARGSTAQQRASRKGMGVYPACAGIHPCSRNTTISTLSLPRMRGDPPLWFGL